MSKGSKITTEIVYSEGPARFRRLWKTENLKLLLGSFDQKYVKILESKIPATDKEVFEALAKKTRKTNRPYNSKKILAFEEFLEPNMKILDFGGANGQIANALQEFKTEVTVADTTIPKNRVPGLKYVELKSGPLPFKDNEFDVTCCFMVLHHIKERQQILKELTRVTKKFLFVQEHNVLTREEKDLIDIQHGMYMYVLQTDDYDKTKNFDEWEAFYFPAETLLKELNELGFKRIMYRPSKSGYLTKNYFATFVKE